MSQERLVGTICRYYDNSGMAVLELIDTLGVGQQIHIKGPRDDCLEVVEQMELANHKIQFGLPGELVNIKIGQKIHENDKVFVRA
ncbi:MAG: hypothetical protein KGJ93_04845 [Patescibacteria group bacterium]|nr:hypothetical protein [Patescibacteria group bacterium]